MSWLLKPYHWYCRFTFWRRRVIVQAAPTCTLWRHDPLWDVWTFPLGLLRPVTAEEVFNELPR